MKQDIQFGIFEGSLPIEGPWGVKLAAESGFQGVQLDVGSYARGFPKSKQYVQEIYRDLAKEYGISYPSIACSEHDTYSMVAAKGSADREIAIQTVEKAIEAAVALDIPRIMVKNFLVSSIDTEKDFQRAAEVIKQVSDEALEHDITIALENVLSVEELTRFIETVGNPNVKLYFDTQNYYFFYKLYTPDLIPALMPYICEVHVKDGRRDDLSPAGALLGEGDSDFFATIEALKKHNYQGWLVSENFYDHGPISSIAEDSVELMRRDLKTLQELF